MVLPNGDRWETPFVQDRMHGTEVFLSSNGERRELEWLRHRPYQGEFTLSDDRGVQVVAATLVEGEVTALALPEAELVPVDRRMDRLRVAPRRIPALLGFR